MKLVATTDQVLARVASGKPAAAKAVLVVDDGAYLHSTLAAIDAELTVRAKAVASVGYGCLMAPLDWEASVKWAQQHIAHDTLVADGIETEPHVTVMFGFNLPCDTAALAKLVSNAYQPLICLGKVSRFECPEYDVLKLDVHSPALEQLHKDVATAFGKVITRSQHAYHPHLTLAYVAKGSNRQLDGNPAFDGLMFRPQHLVYSEPEHQNRQFMPLHALPPAQASNACSRHGGGQPGASATVQGADPTLHPAPLDFRHVDPNSFAYHDKARQAAEQLYREAVGHYLSAVQHEAAKAKRKKKVEDELLTLWLMLMDDAEQAGYHAVTYGLGAGRGIMRGEPQAFAAKRQDYLRPFAKRTWDKVSGLADTVRAAGGTEKEVLQAAKSAAAQVANGEGQVLAKTEAQATYGDAQRRLLAQAGYRTKVWMTMEDERVRPTHQECGQQGEVPMDKPFANGLQFPGDPNGGPEEVCNCRCWLVGGSR